MRSWSSVLPRLRGNPAPAGRIETMRVAEGGGLAPVTIRRAGLDDDERLGRMLLSVQQLHFAADPSFFNAPGGMRAAREVFRVELNRPRSRAYLAEASGTALGYILYAMERQRSTFVTRGDASIHIHHIAVVAEARRRGIGSSLLRIAEADARTQGVATVVLESWSFNEGAQGFFRAVGYEPSVVTLRKSVGAGNAPS